MLLEEYTLSHYETNSWVLESQSGHFIITVPAKELLELLSQSSSISEACTAFNFKYGYQFHEEQFWEFISNRLGFTGLLKNHEAVVVKDKKFISLQFTIFNAALAGRLASPLQVLFNKAFFYTSFTILLGLAIYSLFSLSFQSEHFSVFNLMALYLLTIILHELGHIAACKKFTGKNGEIGGGLYLIFPVLFSNITALWHAKKDERVIGNLAGVYIQLFCLLVFYGMHGFYPDIVLFNQIVFMLAWYSILQLVPFIRSDGYWLLSDITSTPNLLTRANQSLKEFLASPVKYFTTEAKPKGLFLLAYSVFNNAIIIYFIGLQVLSNLDAILYFPLYLFRILEHLVHLEPVGFDFSYFPVVLFYIVVFQWIKRFLGSVFKSKKEPEAQEAS